MSPALRVVAPGLLTTVQDFGRPGYQHLGISVGGALDPVSLRAANLLAGNPVDAAALEVAYLGPTLAVEADDVRLAIAGAAAAIDILRDGEPTAGIQIESGRSVRLRRGDVIRIGSLSQGAVLYVAVEGGFAIAPVLGSVSTCMRGGFGGWQGRPLIADDRLPLCRASASERDEVRLDGPDHRTPTRVRAVLGPQSDHFSEEELAAFFAAEFVAGAGSNRMGMRLEGRAIRHAGGLDIVSDAIAPGSVQVPGNGQPIVLLADRQTTGGYPKIATVISADLPALGRVPVGARIAFEQVTLAEAEAARHTYLAELERMSQCIVPIRTPLAPIGAALFECNLISGVFDAAA